MNRAAFVMIGIAATLLLAGCGNQTVTASETQGGITVQVVITSDSTAMTAARDQPAMRAASSTKNLIAGIPKGISVTDRSSLRDSDHIGFVDHAELISPTMVIGRRVEAIQRGSGRFRQPFVR